MYPKKVCDKKIYIEKKGCNFYLLDYFAIDKIQPGASWLNGKVMGFLLIWMFGDSNYSEGSSIMSLGVFLDA